MKAGIQSTLWSIVATVCLLGCTKSGSSETPVTIPPVTPPKDTIPSLANVRSWLVDKAATAETAALFYNLKKVAKTGILFGHQDATKRGVTDASTQWANEQHLPAVSRDRSDVKDVTGAYPAVYGHDFLHIANFNISPWFQYEASIARQLTIDAYNRGGVNTFAWHYNNPVSKGSFYWNESKVAAVGNILPGGSHNDVFKQSLKEIAEFATSLVGADGKLVPVIFRPFHEFDGDWFWWGKAHCTADQYKQLYQFTVTYLRDSLGVRNFLYAWSPDKNFNTELQYLERYPGDAYVDLVGMDNYGDMAVGTAPSVAGAKLKIISDYAIRKKKLAALTETGLSRLPQSDWFTALLQKALQSSTPQLAYVLVWANTKDHFWTPYKGHPAEADFIKFKQSPYVHFGDEMPKMYEIK
ncbi:glycoside hydrolase family 26 protein [Pseudocnuella soli]|uniref:glycoside hydrolase family 26 protein n=1 Tax=Pseudocnuella soli TaxID=2502779 RepID=UPI00104DB4CD|nr:glycosyl hydrolase [Pseudocnuella soli]